VPPGVAVLNSTLRVLDFNSSGPLQLDEAGVAAILQCSRLTTLGLSKPGMSQWRYELGPVVWQPIAQRLDREGYTPAQYSVESMWHLMRLPAAFRERHGRDLKICVLEEEHNKHLSFYDNEKPGF